MTRQKWCIVQLEDNVENMHGNNPQYAYFYADVVINGEEVGIKIDVRKSIETNKFWMHSVQINKNSDLLSPATTQVLNENQSSYKGNIPQNSKNATKKYSIDIDDSLFSALQDTYSAQEQETASIIQEGFESMKRVSVDAKIMHKIAYEIRKEYKSNYEIKKLEQNLTRVFAYLKDHADTVGYEDMVRIVQEVAKPVIEESMDVDPLEQEIYSNFRSYLKGKTIRLNEEQKSEVAHYYGSYENFRKMNFGNITFSENGTYLDSLWTEIADNAYQMLDYDASLNDPPKMVHRST